MAEQIPSRLNRWPPGILRYSIRVAGAPSPTLQSNSWWGPIETPTRVFGWRSFLLRHLGGLSGEP